MRAIPHEHLAEMSPQMEVVRTLCKVPMVLVLFSSSTLIGLDLIFFKYAQVLFNEDLSVVWPTMLLYDLVGLCCAVLSMHLLNLCEKIFD